MVTGEGERGRVGEAEGERGEGRLAGIEWEKESEGEEEKKKGR